MPEPTEKGNGTPPRRANLQMRFTEFLLPPIQDALIIGKRATAGANSISRAFQEMSPGEFQLIRVEHPVAEAVLIRASHLRKIPESELIGRLLRHAGQMMGETDALHVRLGIEIIIEEENIEV